MATRKKRGRKALETKFSGSRQPTKQTLFDKKPGSTKRRRTTQQSTGLGKSSSSAGMIKELSKTPKAFGFGVEKKKVKVQTTKDIIKKRKKK
jgi:hypothetical protein